MRKKGTCLSKFVNESIEFSIHLQEIEELNNVMDLDYSEEAEFSMSSKKSKQSNDWQEYLFEDPEKIKQKKEEKLGTNYMVEKMTTQKKNTM